MTNIRPLFFLLLAVSIVGSVACGTNEPTVTPTITVQVVPQIFRSTSTPSVPTSTNVLTVAPTPAILPIPSSGVFVTKWGTGRTGNGEFNEPFGVAVASDGSVYVTESEGNRVQKFAPAS